MNNAKPSLFSLDEGGNIRWIYIHNNNQQYEKFSYAEGTIDTKGNIYFAFDSLYSVNYAGELNWKKELNGRTETPLVCDINNNIYIAVKKKDGSMTYESYTETGKIKWQVKNINKQSFFGHSPCLLNEAIIYPTWKLYNKLLFIK